MGHLPSELVQELAAEMALLVEIVLVGSSFRLIELDPDHMLFGVNIVFLNHDELLYLNPVGLLVVIVDEVSHLGLE